MNTVERIIKLCKEQNIPISRLEKECGFANGYIARLRKGTVPNDRLVKIADYLNVSESYLNNGTTDDLDKNAITLAKALKNEDVMEGIELLLKLPEERKKIVLSLIKELGKDR